MILHCIQWNSEVVCNTNCNRPAFRFFFIISFDFNNNNKIFRKNVLKWEEYSKSATAPFKEETQPTYRPTNKYRHTHTHTHKKIKSVYARIQRVQNVESFNFKSSTDDASLISRARLFHSSTILFIKLNLNKLVL